MLHSGIVLSACPASSLQGSPVSGRVVKGTGRGRGGRPTPEEDMSIVSPYGPL